MAFSKLIVLLHTGIAASSWIPGVLGSGGGMDMVTLLSIVLPLLSAVFTLALIFALVVYYRDLKRSRNHVEEKEGDVEGQLYQSTTSRYDQSTGYDTISLDYQLQGKGDGKPNGGYLTTTDDSRQSTFKDPNLDNSSSTNSSLSNATTNPTSTEAEGGSGDENESEVHGDETYAQIDQKNKQEKRIPLLVMEENDFYERRESWPIEQTEADTLEPSTPENSDSVFSEQREAGIETSGQQEPDIVGELVDCGSRFENADHVGEPADPMTAQPVTDL